VFERDGLRCSFVAGDGHRCTATAFLELDHIEPRAFGGAHELKNIRIFCRTHNQRAAEQVFGRRAVEERRAERQQRSDALAQVRQRKRVWPVPSEANEHQRPPSPSRNASPRQSPSHNSRQPVARVSGLGEWKTVHGALRNLGFREGETRAVIAALQRKFDGGAAPPLTEVLREALLLATASALPSRNAHAALESPPQ